MGVTISRAAERQSRPDPWHRATGLAGDPGAHRRGREAALLAVSGGVAVFAKVTGDYDKTGLPDPLELRFYFTLAGDAIAQLIVIPAKRP